MCRILPEIYLNREGDTKAAQAVDSEWKRRVLKVHTDRKREIPLNKNGKKDKSEIYKLYGSILASLMIIPTFFFTLCSERVHGDYPYTPKQAHPSNIHHSYNADRKRPR